MFLSRRGFGILFLVPIKIPTVRLDLPPWYRSNSSRPLRKGQSRIRSLEQTFAERCARWRFARWLVTKAYQSIPKHTKAKPIPKLSLTREPCWCVFALTLPPERSHTRTQTPHEGFALAAHLFGTLQTPLLFLVFLPRYWNHLKTLSG